MIIRNNVLDSLNKLFGIMSVRNSWGILFQIYDIYEASGDACILSGRLISKVIHATQVYYVYHIKSKHCRLHHLAEPVQNNKFWFYTCLILLNVSFKFCTNSFRFGVSFKNVKVFLKLNWWKTNFVICSDNKRHVKIIKGSFALKRFLS